MWGACTSLHHAAHVPGMMTGVFSFSCSGLLKEAKPDFTVEQLHAYDCADFPRSEHSERNVLWCHVCIAPSRVELLAYALRLR